MSTPSSPSSWSISWRQVLHKRRFPLATILRSSQGGSGQSSWRVNSSRHRGQVGAGAPGVFTPFGVGVHHCAGRGFAETQLPLIVATLLHEAEMELVPPTYELKTERWMLFPSVLPDKGLRFRIGRRRH